MSSSTKDMDSPEEADAREPSDDPLSDHPTAPISCYSSIHQAALGLVKAAEDQANRQAALSPREFPSLQEQLLEERRKCAVQRANAEQARRSSECARDCLEALLQHITQPFLALDEDGRITRWNAPFARWIGISADSALNQPIANLFSVGVSSQILAANIALRAAVEAGASTQDPLSLAPCGSLLHNEGIDAARITLLPLFRIPGVIESVLVLLEPSSSL